jgi:hypothetical protein
MAWGVHGQQRLVATIAPSNVRNGVTCVDELQSGLVIEGSFFLETTPKTA